MRLIILSVPIVFALSCGSNSKSSEDEIPTYDTSTIYYDIPLAVQNELTEIRKNASSLHVITTDNGTRDSMAIDTIQLTKLAAPFLEYNLNDRKYRKYYKEDPFEDTDLKRIILNYSTEHPDFALKSASVLLQNETHKLTDISIKRMYLSKDTLYDENLSWVSGRNFLVLQKKSIGEKEFIRKTQVFWKAR